MLIILYYASILVSNINSSFIDGPAIMGIINCSQDSFYAPSAHFDAALKQAETMVAEGADILDIGAEATNPHVDISRHPSSDQREIDQIIPLVEAIKQRFDTAISIDTSRYAVMSAAINVGADMINDQRALQSEGALDLIKTKSTPVCLMDFPIGRSPGQECLETFIQSVKDRLLCFAERCLAAGMQRDNIILDPGFGQGHYGKNLDENYYLLAHLNQIVDLGFPVLSGWSRKSMIGDVIGGVPATQRLPGSITAAVLAAQKGASILRVHDVKATCDALSVLHKMNQMGSI
jgi:dihydropteroate synthase